MAIGNLDLTSLDRTLMTNEQKSLLNVSNVSQKEIEQLLIMRGQVQEFQMMMMKYDCALSEVRTKLEVLNKELSLKNNRNPFESIKSRIKTPVSIYEKLTRKGVPFSIENIESNISDIAGCRAICSFVDDIYMVANCLKKQDDVNVLVEKDYIATPKDSGYRSLHLIIETPIFLTDVKEYMKVEVQFRTIAMDFWASLEHKMKYKKDIENAELISEDLKFSADLINQLDRRMQQIRERIDAGDGKPYGMTPTEEEERADCETMEIIRREIQAEQSAANARRKKKAQ
ncbi:GTP pyrophosphokinase [Butyrivibrio sp. VCD2006]|uniref:GTP pyrophosphokinase n=1 Tax=Butyrivibrio sp. VCD2006 TaxID=1280664 RepID=UPI000424846A|nr:GTP pyrophosphokinase family protein [Butyrivibrio sp. VCD2006]